jgi:hypothetical protein
VTLVRITRPGVGTVVLRIPDSVDWVTVVERCQKEFSASDKWIGGPEMPKEKP